MAPKSKLKLSKYGPSDKKDFEVYQKVFARMKSWPPWPAKIMPQKFENPSMFSNCIVYFYGTRQIGECLFVDIYDYEANKERFKNACQSSKSLKIPFQTALTEIQNDDGSEDDQDMQYAHEKMEFEAPICDMVEKVKNKMEEAKKQKKKQGEDGQTKRGYQSQEDEYGYDSIPEDDTTADDDDDNDDDFYMNRRSRSQSRSRSRTKQRKGDGTGASRRKGGGKKKAAPRTRKAAEPDSELEEEDAHQSPGVVNEEDFEGVLVRTKNPAALLKEFLSKECELVETNILAVPKIEKALCNLHYRSNVVAATTPDGCRVEFQIRPESGPGSAAVPQGPAELAAFQARVEELEALKTALESGASIPPKYQLLVMAQKTPEHQALLRAKREASLAFVRLEAQLLEQIRILKDNLTMGRANCNAALEAINTVMMLDVRPLTLKKFPEVLQTFRQLQDYRATNLKNNLPPSQQKMFDKVAGLIRNGADFVMEKFSALFEFPDEMSFYEAFYHELVAFNEETRGVPLGDILLLTD